MCWRNVGMVITLKQVCFSLEITSSLNVESEMTTCFKLLNNKLFVLTRSYEGYTDRLTRIWKIIKVYKLYYSIGDSWFLEALIIFDLSLSYVFHSGSLCCPPWKKYIFSTLKCHLSLFVPFPGFYDFQSSFRLSQWVKNIFEVHIVVWTFCSNEIIVPCECT